MAQWQYETSEDIDDGMADRLRRFPRRPDMLVYTLRLISALAIRCWLRLYHRLRIVGAQNLPRQGSFVLVANHRSHLDTLCLLSALPLSSVHRAFPAAAQDYFFVSTHRLAVATIVVNALPFDRQTRVRQSLALCSALLGNAGNILVLFPEGRRSTTDELSAFKPGVGMLVAGTRHPVVPCFLLNTAAALPKGRWFPRPAKIELRIGRPMTFENAGRHRDEAERVSSALRDAVQVLAAPMPAPPSGNIQCPRGAQPVRHFESRSGPAIVNRQESRHFSVIPAARPLRSVEHAPPPPAARSIMKVSAMSSAPRTETVPQPIERTLTLWDGTELFYRAWLPAEPTDKALILFHRGHEHSGRFADVVEELGLRDVAVFAWDARGHGRSPGLRGYAPSFGTTVKDADFFVRHVCERYGKKMEDTVVLAHSVGAVTASAWVHDYAPPIRGLILATPALRVKLYIPLAVPGLRLLQKMRGDKPAFVKSYVKAKMLTHDADQARRYDADPLIARSIAVNILLGLHDASTRLIADAAAIRVPTLLMCGDSDWVVHVGAQKRFFDRLGSADKTFKIFPGMYHDILHEKQRGLVLDEARKFIAGLFDRPPRRSPLLDADERGFAKEEHDRLARPLPALSPKRWAFAATRLWLKSVCRLSDGVRIGWRTGFDSGLSLDHVYKNRAGGKLLLGRLIDRIYLDSSGWRGIRRRRANLEATLRAAIDRTVAEGRAVRVLDVAAGCGRYVLNVLRDRPEAESVLLRDYTPANLEEGRRIADEMGLKRVRFEQGDAFDPASLAAIEPAPTVVIVSGLYELFPDNKKVLASLGGIAAAMREGGYLIYTGQPSHPQLEFIARTLVNRDGRPWVMRRRTQEELDDLVRAAGFEKVGMEIDEMGIFTVSLARRTRV